MLRTCLELWGMPFPNEYMKLYNSSALAIKAVDGQIKVGFVVMPFVLSRLLTLEYEGWRTGDRRFV